MSDTEQPSGASAHDDAVDAVDAVDAMTSEPPVFGEARHSVLSPSGQYESEGDFARGLGARRVKVVVFATGGVLLVLALLTALQ